MLGSFILMSHVSLLMSHICRALGWLGDSQPDGQMSRYYRGSPVVCLWVNIDLFGPQLADPMKAGGCLPLSLFRTQQGPDLPLRVCGLLSHVRLGSSQVGKEGVFCSPGWDMFSLLYS